MPPFQSKREVYVIFLQTACFNQLLAKHHIHQIKCVFSNKKAYGEHIDGKCHLQAQRCQMMFKQTTNGVYVLKIYFHISFQIFYVNFDQILRTEWKLFFIDKPAASSLTQIKM